MAYRLTKRAAAARQRRCRPDIDPSEQRTSVELPDRRRVLIVIDYDTGEPLMQVIELFRSNRIDTYRAVVNGKPWRARIGWSRVLDRLRVALPRTCAQSLNMDPRGCN